MKKKIFNFFYVLLVLLFLATTAFAQDLTSIEVGITKSIIQTCTTGVLPLDWIDANCGGGTGGPGGGAPTDATYITQTPNSTLTAEQALSLLSTGLLQVTTTTGVLSSITTSAGVAGLISDETGSGALVFGTSPTLTTPTIASFTNATHTHTNAAGGGQITDAALSAAVTVPKGGSGATTLTGILLGNGTSPFTTITTSAGIAGAITDETGTGLLVLQTSPTIITPTIASLTNAQHSHTNAAGGGQITDAALSSAVSVAKGGTGQTTLTAHGVIIGNGVGAVAVTAVGTTGTCLSGNTGADPTFQACAAIDPDLTAIAGFTSTGFAVRTGTDTWAQRQITGQGGNIVITNSGGVGGDVIVNLGTTAVQTDQDNTYTTGAQNFNAASSFHLPMSAGAAPTTSSTCAYNSTGDQIICGFNGVSRILATTTGTQPLDTDLTQIASLAPINNQYLLWRGVGSAWTVKTRAGCSGAGQSVNFDATSGEEGCVTHTGGISGLTPGVVPRSATSTTLTDSLISQSGSTVTVGGGFVVGAAGPYVIHDTSAITATDKTLTYINFGGTLRPSTGALTPGNMVTTNANGQYIDGGTVGTGTWTDSSTNTGTNKTLNAEGTGNVFTSVSVIQLDFASCVGSVAFLNWDTDATGIAEPTADCGDAGTLRRPNAIFSGSAVNALTRTIRLPTGWTGNIDFKLRYVSTAASPTGNVEWDIETQCRAVGQTWDASFNAAQTITDAQVAQNTLNDANQASLTITNCAAGEDLTIRVSRDGTNDTSNNTASALYALLTLRWVQQAQ